MVGGAPSSGQRRHEDLCSILSKLPKLLVTRYLRLACATILQLHVRNDKLDQSIMPGLAFITAISATV